MAVSNGQLANQTTFNNAFVSRTTDSDTIGKVDLENAAVESGPNVTNVQREVNSLNSYTGRPSGSDFDETPSWSSNNVGNSTDNLFERVDAIDAEFGTSGHDHDGVNSAQVDAADLDNINLFFAVYSTKSITAANGLSNDVSTNFSGDTPGGTATAEGVVTTAPHNKVVILNDDGDQIEDSSGNQVYGRLTEAVGVWTLTYYVNDAGVETAHNLSSQDIVIYYKEVFDQFNRPTFGADFGDMLSADMTSDVVDASATQRGLVSTGVQTFAGNKTFSGTISASNLSGTNSGDVTLNLIGSSPNGNGASLSGQSLTLQPADATFGGVLTAIAQSILGVKTFLSGLITNTLRLTTSLEIEDPGAGTNKVTIQAPTLSGDYTLTLPVDDGLSNQVLQTNGSGVLSWVNPSAGSSPLTTKGDLFTYDTADARLPVGTDGQILQSNSATSTGLEWIDHVEPNLSTATKTTNYTLVSTDQVIFASASGGSFTLTLPTAVGISGKVYKIIRTDQTLANAVTIDANGSETIDGNLTRSLATQWERIEIISNGTNWVILSRDHSKEAVSYTPTVYGTTTNPTKGTGGVETAYWRRDGDCIEIHYTLTQSVAGADGSGTYLWSLPSGLTIDGNKIVKTNLNEDGVCGSSGFRANASTTQASGVCKVYDDGGGKAGILIYGVPEAGANLSVVGSGTYGFGTNAVARYTFDARVPVTGWE